MDSFDAAPGSLQIVQQQLDAYNAGQLDAFTACYSPAITLTRLPEGEVAFQGLDELRPAYGQLFSANPNLHCTIAERIVLGRFVIDHERIAGYADGNEAEAVVIYEVADGLIARVWVLRS
jgi:hypothetical protein